jgi:hypothetical protein
VTITGLTNDTEYTVYLRAVNSVGNGAASLAVTGTPNPSPDMLSGALSTSLAEYEAAPNGSWIKITAAEYNNLASTITDSTKVAATDEILNAVTGGGISNTSNVFVANHRDTRQIAIPANSYLFAVVIQWASKTPTDETLIYINNTAANYTGFSKVGGYLPNLVGANPNVSPAMAKNHYVFKKPSSTTTPNGGLLGFFSGLTNLDGYGSGWWVGSLSRSVPPIIRPGQGFHYATNLGSEPTISTNMPGALIGLDNYAVGMQGLSTTVKQW